MKTLISQKDSQAGKEIFAVGFFFNNTQLKDLYDTFRKKLAYLAGYREILEYLSKSWRSIVVFFKMFSKTKIKRQSALS